MFAKSALLCALFAASAQLALAQPYCLLTAVNKFEHPADQKTLCCTDASQVKSYIGDLCPAGDKSDALTAFKTACQEAGYGSCSSSSSSSSSSASGSKTATATATSSGYASASGTSAPYPIVYTSTYYDTVCSCTKTAAISSTGVAGSTGFATGTAPIATGTSAASGAASGSGSGSGAGATGSPIAPVVPSKTGSAGAAGFTGAATKNIGSVAAGLLAVAGIAVAL